MSRDFETELKANLPEYYSQSLIAQGIMETEGAEFENVSAVFWDILMQAFVDTATWGMDRWESLYGIPTDPSKTLEQRRSAIKSKMRGHGTVTVQTLLNLIEPFGVGNSVVVENFENYSIDITFVGTRGMPANLTQINESLRVFAPAHLALNYSYTYVTFGELESETWDGIQFKSDLTERTWTEVETSFFS